MTLDTLADEPPNANTNTDDKATVPLSHSFLQCVSHHPSSEQRRRNCFISLAQHCLSREMKQEEAKNQAIATKGDDNFRRPGNSRYIQQRRSNAVSGAASDLNNVSLGRWTLTTKRMFAVVTVVGMR